MSRWRVYVVLCSDGTLYCGATTDTMRRLRQHNGELRGGARYTSSRRPVVLLVSWGAASRSEACSLESSFKRLTRVAKLGVLACPYDWQNSDDVTPVPGLPRLLKRLHNSR